MAKIKLTYARSDTWGELSDKLVKHYGLPNGSRFALVRKKPNSSSRPYMRSDFEIQRKLFRTADFLHPGNTRISLVCAAVEQLLSPRTRSTVVALGPDGVPLSKNSMLKKWKELPGIPTIEQRNAAEIRRGTLEILRQASATHLSYIDEGIEDPHTEVPEAMLMALIDRYGQNFVQASIQELRLA